MAAKFDREEFARVWNSAGSIAEVMQYYMLSLSGVESRAATARRDGFTLKSFLTAEFDKTEFANRWNNAGSLAEVLDLYPELSIKAIVTRASRLRDEGFKLKSFRRQYNVDRFVDIWNTAGSIHEVRALYSDCTLQALNQRAKALRDRGHKLQRFERGAPRK